MISFATLKLKNNFTKLFVISLITFLTVNNYLLAQSNLNALQLHSGIDESSTLHEIQKEFNDYWAPYNVTDGFYLEDGVEKKAAGWKIFKRWEWYWESRVNPVTGEFPGTNAVIELEKTKNSLNKTSDLNESWVNLGTNSSAGGYAGIGRINCVAFHPTDLNIFWVGSPSGGIWRTTNGGSNWTILNNNEPVLGVSDIAIPSDYATSNTIYIATGDRDGGSIWSLGGGQGADNPSIGVLKSIDGGVTWNTTGLSFTPGFARITRLLIDPTDNNILLASTLAGIYRTSDAGVSWALVDPYQNRWIDMEFKPGDHNIIYASSSGYASSYLNISTDNGVTWSFSAIVTGGYRAEIAVTPNDPTVVYMLSCTNTGGLLGIHKSTDSGANFSQVNTNTTQNMLGYYCDGSGPNSGQGTYDLCIAVSPTDANTVFIGGINTWKSSDGGVTWNLNNMWVQSPTVYKCSGYPIVHADKHTLAFQNGTTLFEGNDGGIYKTTNGGTNWTDLSNGLVISQLYRIGVSQTSVNTVLTGLQDNGTKLFNGGFWTDAVGGDGMECIVDFSNANYMYATYVQGRIYRSTNGGISFPTVISNNIPGPPTGAWVTPYIIDQNNSSTLFAGYDRVWKTTDRGNTWTSASQVLSSSFKLRSLAIAPSNSNIIYVADQTNMWKTIDGGSTNWSSVILPAISNSITYIAIKNDDPNTVWITVGGYTDGEKVFESTDGGSSWTNISAGLPNIPVMCVVQYKSPTDRDVLFVGTDAGVYAKNGVANWASYNVGLPNVVVTELEIHYSSGGAADILRAGTYGRGLWETEILAPLPVELSSFSASLIGSSIKLIWQTQTEVNNYGFE